MSPLGQYYPLSEAAKLVDRSPQTLLVRIKLQSLKAKKVGTLWFVHLSELKNKYPDAFNESEK